MTDFAAPPASTTTSTVAPLDVEGLRADFPILQLGHNTGKPLAYLDSASSAQKPLQVLDALRASYETSYANVHRGVYYVAAAATEQFEGAREKVRAFIGATTPREIIFTRGTTEAINLVAWAWGMRELEPGDIVLVTELEHHSNLVPWQQIAAERGAEVRFIPVDDDGVLGDLSEATLDKLVEGGRLRMVATTHVSNSLGTIVPVRQIADWAHARGALMLVDGAQSAPHMPIDVAALGCDFYAFSGHKLMGPTGIGVLWGRESVLADMKPFHYGGEMIRRVTFEQTTFNDLPWKFEAGTPPFVQAIGLGAAIDYINALGREAIQVHEHYLTDLASAALRDVPGLRLLGPAAGAPRAGVMSFTMEGTHPHDIASVLDTLDVNVRAGHHCTQPLMKRLGVHATARASVYAYNTPSDIERLIDGLHHVRKVFGLS